MKPIEIEAWALRVLEMVESRQRVEDSAVELKADWLEPAKAARRLAGHANAARGERILWLVGVDEDQGIVGARNEELSKWFPSVSSHFDAVTPALRDLQVHYKNKVITALSFDTARAPYLVKNPNFGKLAGECAQWEVPWREG